MVNDMATLLSLWLMPARVAATWQCRPNPTAGKAATPASTRTLHG
jgi:hypothetical protein